MIKCLSEYIKSKLLTENSISDDQILYWTGILALNSIEQDRAKRIVKKFNIAKSNPRPGVIKMMKASYADVIDKSKEIIPRTQWNLQSLIGETEYQLMHPDYYKAANEILKEHKRNHDVLTIFQCSKRKPYNTNRLFKYGFMEPYGEFTDFACISNPGIIPFEYSGHYPYRYDEWSVTTEKGIKDIVGLTHKYRIVNLCRFLRFVREMGYKQVIAVIPNPLKNWVFECALENNIEGAEDWLQICISKQYVDALKRKPKYKKLADIGMIFTRLLGFKSTKERYYKCLKKASDDAKGVKAAWKEYKSKLSESLDKPQYQLKDHIDYQEIMKKFKDHIKDNMDDPSVDKGDNDLYYKSYYWSALDLMLIGLDGNLVKDIDGDYWDFVEKLDNDKDFSKFGRFLYAYRPLMKNDKLSMDKFEKEAYKLKLLEPEEKPELKSSLFN